MNEKENIENMNPDLPEPDAEGFDNAEEITSVDKEKTYVPYEEEAPYEASPENVMNLGHLTNPWPVKKRKRRMMTIRSHSSRRG